MLRCVALQRMPILKQGHAASPPTLNDPKEPMQSRQDKAIEIAGSGAGPNFVSAEGYNPFIGLMQGGPMGFLLEQHKSASSPTMKYMSTMQKTAPCHIALHIKSAPHYSEAYVTCSDGSSAPCVLLRSRLP
eukprot:4385931-Amphidinium_carterae.1